MRVPGSTRFIAHCPPFRKVAPRQEADMNDIVTARRRLPHRRGSTNFNFEIGGLAYTCSYSRFADGRLGELFLSSNKSNSQADTNARDAAITFSIAVQHGADVDVIRRALCRDGQGRPSRPLAAALDRIADDGGAP
jgi:ribonucleoside-diphosphate reductase alpha chain